MATTTRSLLIAIAMIAVGVVAFLFYLSLVCGECDGHSYGLLDWVMAGVLIGPGFGLLIKWLQARNERRAGGRR